MSLELDRMILLEFSWSAQSASSWLISSIGYYSLAEGDCNILEKVLPGFGIVLTMGLRGGLRG